MKRLVALMFVWGIGAILLGGCSSGTPVGVTSTQNVNLLITVEGNVQLMREGWKDYVPIGFGTMLSSTDLLKVDGKASVLCTDLSVKALGARGRCPCPTDQGLLEYNGFEFSSSQRSVPSEIPYVLYPRNTLVLEEHPLLHWHATGVTRYRVSIEKSGEVVWSQSDVVSDTLRYPTDAPPLQPGIDYLLMVQDSATGYTSKEDPAKGLGFQILSVANRQIIEQQRSEVLSLALDESARQMVLAVYYLGLESKGEGQRRLWGEAWRLLESVTQTRDAPAVYLRLGDVLAAMKLRVEAETAYQRSLQRAEPLGDLETQAAAHTALWRITGDMTHFDRAITLYETLGDTAMATKLRQESGTP